MHRTRRILLIIVVVLLLTVLIGPFLVPVPPLDDLVSEKELADPDSEFVTVPLGDNTLTLHTKQAGEGGTPLVLLHGFAASIFTWREVLQPLAARRHVVAFDRPAFGLTERPMRETWGDAEDWRTLNPYSAQAQVELTIRMLDQQGIDKAVLVGNSAGGTVAMLTALAHPERVAGLILLDPAVYTGGGTPAWLRPIFNTPQMRHLGPLMTRRIRDWGIEFGKSAWHDPNKATTEVWEGYLKPLSARNWDRALWELTSNSRPSGLSERLAEFTLPLLVITGDDDRIVPTAESIRLAQELPNAELVVIPNCGHAPQEECPAETLVAMEEWLKR